MKNILQLLLIFILLYSPEAYSQSENSDLIERTTERYSEITPAPVDFSDLTDHLERMKDHPVNINSAGTEELSQLTFLNDRQIKNLNQYLQTYGTVYSIYELMAIDGFDSATVMKMKPYIRIGPETEKHPLRPKEIFKYGKSQLILRYEQVLQKQAGYGVADSILAEDPDAGYMGSPVRLMFRYTWTYYDRLSFGISGEKDPGEQFFKGSQKNGMDFYSGFVSLQHTGILQQLTLGTFNADFGQGLTLSTGISSGAIPGTGNLRRYAGGIRPSQSLNEENYLRGIAVVLKKGRFRFSGFWSNHRRDANVTVVDSISGQPSDFSTFTETGYHRLPKEILNKNVLRETRIGGNLNFRNSFLSVGLTGIRSHWSASLNPEIHPYSRFALRGKENLVLGIDLQALWRDLFFFGEASRSQNGGMAFLSGIQANAEGVLFSLTYRNYQRNYQNLLSNAIGQNSTNSNEEGILFSFSAAILPRLGLSGYADIYRFPWLKYRNDNPSLGKEFQVQADLSAVKSVIMYLRFRTRSGQINDGENVRMVNVPASVRSTSLRYQAKWQVGSATALRTRVEWLQSRTGNAKPGSGYLISQDLSYKIQKPRISFSFLYALFDTDSYNERIYAYESDVPYGYSVPAYSGKGLRFLLLVGWNPFRFLDFWVRYAHTWYSDRNVIGTGLDQVSGNTKSEMEVQVRFRF
ncbi:MAG: helix-hairpin-helix domain-containing protein [Bacteroidetes bacterium]|nr:helix-hairpin-helix domain-containing protein [Bacteroidota bacterium]